MWMLRLSWIHVFLFNNKFGRTTEYSLDLLEDILVDIGFVFVAVCPGGAAVCNPGDGGA